MKVYASEWLNIENMNIKMYFIESDNQCIFQINKIELHSLLTRLTTFIHYVYYKFQYAQKIK